MPQKPWPLHRYSPPQLPSSRPRLAGYNAQRQRSAFDKGPSAAEVQQGAREDQPIFGTPPPAAPLRRGADAPAGLAIQDPEIAREVAQPFAGAPFAREVLDRNVPPAPGADLALKNLAGANLGEPDVPALAQDPAPLSPGERAGRTVQDLLSSGLVNPASPDIKAAVPSIFGIAHEAIKPTAEEKETDAQRLEREARADAAERAGALHGAQAGEVHDNAVADRSVKGAHAGMFNATAGLRGAQTTTEQQKPELARYKAEMEHWQALRDAGKISDAQMIARHKAALEDYDRALAEKSPGMAARAFGAEDTAAHHREAARENLTATSTALAGAKPPVEPPAPHFTSTEAPKKALTNLEQEAVTDAQRAIDDPNETPENKADAQSLLEQLKREGKL